MSKVTCPYCGGLIDYLQCLYYICKSSVVRVDGYTLKYGWSDYDESVTDRLLRTEFRCPECDAIITLSEDEAGAFLDGEEIDLKKYTNLDDFDWDR